MSLFLSHLDFERSCRLAGITDLSRDPATGQYKNPGTLATYKVWESVAQSEHVRERPPAWLLRRHGRDVNIITTDPKHAYTPDQWGRMADRGYELPLALYPVVPCASNSAMAVLQERQRQQLAKGYSPERDKRYIHGDLVQAAICYAEQANGGTSSSLAALWPWPGAPIKDETPLRALEKAAALLIAEHERITATAEAQR